MCFSRKRSKSMLTRRRPSSQSYQVATAYGAPSERTVAITAEFGFLRNSTTSAGSGAGGIGAVYVADYFRPPPELNVAEGVYL